MSASKSWNFVLGIGDLRVIRDIVWNLSCQLTSDSDMNFTPSPISNLVSLSIVPIKLQHCTELNWLKGWLKPSSSHEIAANCPTIQSWYQSRSPPLLINRNHPIKCNRATNRVKKETSCRCCCVVLYHSPAVGNRMKILIAICTIQIVTLVSSAAILETVDSTYFSRDAD